MNPHFPPASEVILQVEHLSVVFDQGRDPATGGRRELRAVDDVSFQLKRGETLGIVGESGCGKSTMARAILRLLAPSAGEFWLSRSEDPAESWLPIHTLAGSDLRQVRRHMQLVFQDPYASLNPRMTVGDILAEPLTIFGVGSRGERRDMVRSLMKEVGLDPKHVLRYPHEFSGGQRQRIGIARALALNPSLVILDEPVSALDVSVRSQVLNLLLDLQQSRGLSYLFIAHDLAVVKRISHRVGVMYLGKLVELANSHDLYAGPMHPYTQALLSAIPIPDPDLERSRKRILLSGDLPSPSARRAGCAFASRCPQVMPVCREQVPLLMPVASKHEAACHLHGVKKQQDRAYSIGGRGPSSE